MRRSFSVTLICVAPSTTWLLVTNVAVRRDDDAAADAVLDLRLLRRLRHLSAEEELPQSRRQLLHLASALAATLLLPVCRFHIAVGTCSHGDIDDGGRYTLGHRFHGTIERGERLNAVVVHGCCGPGGMHKSVPNKQCRTQRKSTYRCGRDSQHLA